jgi:hypothetical protein
MYLGVEAYTLSVVPSTDGCLGVEPPPPELLGLFEVHFDPKLCAGVLPEPCGPLTIQQPEVGDLYRLALSSADILTPLASAVR